MQNRVDGDFNMLVGSGAVVAQALDAGAVGGVLALANVAPEGASAVFETHQDGDAGRARALNADLVELNHAVTAEYGIPGLKWAMRERGAPAGYPRSPHREPDADAHERLAALVAGLD
jgi:4-hydroxy-tetrahydrodipicolinate synthase